MLVLSRKPGEKIVIGDGIELMVVAVNGNRVRLGIAASAQHRIIRAECRAGDEVRTAPAGVPQLTACGV